MDLTMIVQDKYNVPEAGSTAEQRGLNLSHGPP